MSAGIEPIAALALLQFKIEQNNLGQFVIKIDSLERMSDPFMELVLDLAWPNGQLYKAYTVLLDPPGYQLVSSTAQSRLIHYKKTADYADESGVIDKPILTNVDHHSVELKDDRKKSTYGPTINSENIWQIAQRYKTSEVLLPQVVLAIVGANPDVFKNGNLNGLKAGVRLVIPATHEIQHIPTELATEEVMAHDKAWNEKNSINHILTPPYMGTYVSKVDAPVYNSEIPATPKFSQQAPPAVETLSQLISVNSLVQVDNQVQFKLKKKPQSNEQDLTTKAELSITTAAVESMRESNALLTDQFRVLQDQNKKLQQQLAKRDKDIELFRTQIQVMMKERQAIASEASSFFSNTQSFSLWPLLFILLFAAGGGVAFWCFKNREQVAVTSENLTTIPVESKPFIAKESLGLKKSDEIQTRPIITVTLPTDDKIIDQQEEVVRICATKMLAASKKHVAKKKVVDKKQAISIQSKPVIASQVVDPVDVKEVEILKESIKELVILPLEDEAEEHPVREAIQIQPTPIGMDSTSVENEQFSRTITDDIKSGEESFKDSMMEFESGLYQLVQEKPIHNIEQTQEEGSSGEQDKLELVTVLPVDPNVNETQASALKSSKALDTLLALAKTYIGMGDFDSAKHSLDEVMEHGNDSQKEEVLRMLEEIKHKV